MDTVDRVGLAQGGNVDIREAQSQIDVAVCHIATGSPMLAAERCVSAAKSLEVAASALRDAAKRLRK